MFVIGHGIQGGGVDRTHLVRLAREENSATSYTESALLLLALLVDLRDRPSLDVIRFGFVRGGSDAVRRVDVGTDWPWRLECCVDVLS